MSFAPVSHLMSTAQYYRSPPLQLRRDEIYDALPSLCQYARIAKDEIRRGVKGTDLADAYTVLATQHEIAGRYRNALKYYGLCAEAYGWPQHEVSEFHWLQFALGHFAWDGVNPGSCLRARDDLPLWDGGPVGVLYVTFSFDEGLGEEVLCASLLDGLATIADHVVMECSLRMKPLLERSFPDVTFVLRSEGYDGPADARAGLYLLLRYLRPTIASFPQPRPFLEPRGALDRERFTVGISWRSDADTTGQRSATIEDFAPLFERLRGCRFIDLQYGDTDAERELVKSRYGIDIERHTDNRDDIDGLLVLINSCDAVVTIANSTQHFAGALGKPTWGLMPKMRGRAAWYWFINRTDSPWYAGMRLAWPNWNQEWSEVVAVAADELRASKRYTERKAA